MKIPSLILKQLYTFGSLENRNGGVQFSVKNRLSDASFAGLKSIKFDGKEMPIEGVTILLSDGTVLPVSAISADEPIDFPLREVLTIRTECEPLAEGKHKLEIAFSAVPFGDLKLKVDDSIVENTSEMVRIPRDKEDDYSDAIIAERQKFVEDFTGAKVSFTAQVGSVSTGAEGRDKHLKEADFFDMEHHPTISFVSKSFAKASDHMYKVVGDLTMRGTTRQVELSANHIGSMKTKDNLNKVGFQLTGSVDRNDFGVSGASGSVAPIIEILCNVEMTEQKLK